MTIRGFFMKKQTLSAAVAGFLLAGGVTAAGAAEPNFNYSAVSLSLASASLDDDVFVPIGGPFEGFAVYDSLGGAILSGSFQAAPNVVIGAAVARFSNSGLGTEINQNELALGLGYVAPIGPATDLNISGEIIRVSAEICNRFGCGDASDTGVAVAAGARHWATRNIEINGAVSYASFSDFENSSSLGLGGAFWFNDNSSVGLSVGFGSNATVASVGYRYAF